MNKIKDLNWQHILAITKTWKFDEFGNPVDYPRTGELPFEYEAEGKLYGDFNDNGVVDLSDLTELSAYLLKDKDFSENQLKAADTNHDEEVTVSDLARLKQYITNEITEL